jgi:16S rRNA (guanine966-N2)-methyltransferase
VRIVAGRAKGRRLAVPPRGTRPTSDRAREALFSSLDALVELDGARVLDLYAGTGAVGLEALSRGAARAVFVESDRNARAVLQRNVDTVGLPGAVVVGRPVSAYLDTDPDGEFDVVFADPPYALRETTLAGELAGLATSGRLAPGAIVVVERSVRSPAPSWPECVTPLRERRYGEGVLWYGRRDETP